METECIYCGCFDSSPCDPIACFWILRMRLPDGSMVGACSKCVLIWVAGMLAARTPPKPPIYLLGGR